MGRGKSEKSPRNFDELKQVYTEQANRVISQHMSQLEQTEVSKDQNKAIIEGVHDAAADMLMRYCGQAMKKNTDLMTLATLVNNLRKAEPRAFFQHVFNEQINDSKELSGNIELKAITTSLQDIMREKQLGTLIDVEFNEGVNNKTIDKSLNRSEAAASQFDETQRLIGEKREEYLKKPNYTSHKATQHAIMDVSRDLFYQNWHQEGERKEEKYGDKVYKDFSYQATTPFDKMEPEDYFRKVTDAINKNPRIRRDTSIRTIIDALSKAAENQGLSGLIPKIKSKGDLSLSERATIASSAVKAKTRKAKKSVSKTAKYIKSEAATRIESAKASAEKRQKGVAARRKERKTARETSKEKPTLEKWDDLVNKHYRQADNYIRKRYRGNYTGKSLQDAARHMLTDHYFNNQDKEGAEVIRQFLILSKDDNPREFFTALENMMNTNETFSNDRNICAIASSLNNAGHSRGVKYTAMNLHINPKVAHGRAKPQGTEKIVASVKAKSEKILSKAQKIQTKAKKTATAGKRKIKTWRSEKIYDHTLKNLRKLYSDMKSITGIESDQHAMQLAIKQQFKEYKGSKSDIIKDVLLQTTSADSMARTKGKGFNLGDFIKTTTETIAQHRDQPVDSKGDLGTLLRAVSIVLYDNQGETNFKVGSKQPENFLNDTTTKMIHTKLQQGKKPQAI